MDVLNKKIKDDIFDEEFINKVYMYCYKHLYDSGQVQDLAQDILLEAVAACKSGREINNFYAWFWQMAHNKVCAYISLKNNEAVVFHNPIDAAYDITDDSEIDRNLIYEEEIAELRQAVAKISKIHREVIILFYLEQRTIKEISKNLSVPEGTVKRRLHDAKKEIRLNLESDNVKNVKSEQKELSKSKNTRKVNKVKNMNANKFNDFKRASLYWWVSGTGLWTNEITQQMYVACMKEAKTVAEIAEEICVAPAYIESIVKDCVEAKGMKVTDDGKYLTDFIIYPQQAYTDFQYEISELFSNIKEPITDILYKVKDKICALDFYGNDFDYEYLLWILYWHAAVKLNDVMANKNKARWEGKVPAGNGKSYRIAGSVTYPGETINERGEKKAVMWSNIYTTYGTANYGKVALFNRYDWEPFPRDRHTRINGDNINLLMKIYENSEYTPNEYEREYAANLVSQNILRNNDGKLYLNLPVMPSTYDEQIKDIIGAEPELEKIAEEYVAKAAEICDRILLHLTREDLLEEYANWIFSGAFWTLSYLFYENKYLQVPEDYNASAAALCLYINT